MPRFVILEHDHPYLHWDFMLEAHGALKTWRLPKPPSATGSRLTAEALGDHRLTYLDYEGPVSGGRGAVMRWDAGDYEVMAADVNVRRYLKLRGRRCSGMVILEKDAGTGWLFTYLPDTTDATSTGPSRGPTGI